MTSKEDLTKKYSKSFHDISEMTNKGYKYERNMEFDKALVQYRKALRAIAEGSTNRRNWHQERIKFCKEEMKSM